MSTTGCSASVTFVDVCVFFFFMLSFKNECVPMSNLTIVHSMLYCIAQTLVNIFRGGNFAIDITRFFFLFFSVFLLSS